MAHILLVEDSRTQALVGTRLLEGAGHSVSLAMTVAEAIELCLETTPDLVILDQYLGEESGLEACRRIKGDIALQLIPVLVLTGSAEERDHIEALDAGADRFLSKGSPPQEMLAAVDRLLHTMPPAETIIRDPETRDTFLRGARILAVDDSRTYLERLSEGLAKSGFQVAPTTSGVEAIELLGQKSFDAGIIDLVMPEMDGFEVCRQARAWADENQKELGLLVLSGRESEEVALEAVEAGADDFVSKSQSMGVVCAHVQSLVRRVRMIRYVNAEHRKAMLRELALREAEWKRQEAEQRARYAEELERSNRELEQFAYVVSHDLKAPLRTISGFGELLQKRLQGRLDEDSQNWLSHMTQGAIRMQALIDDLLAYSRVGREEVASELTSVSSACDEALANLQASIQETGAKVTCDSLPAVVIDRYQLVQLLQNLLGNAIKFHGDQPPEIEVRAVRKGDDWLFSVRDNGIGIAPENVERIFRIFERVHGEEEYPGTGIGLAICKKIVEIHGGRIWVESEPGAGATFYFTIPAEGD
jgi:signal transduction histidine kinase